MEELPVLGTSVKLRNRCLLCMNSNQEKLNPSRQQNKETYEVFNAARSYKTFNIYIISK
jgi:hypothetical protein